MAPADLHKHSSLPTATSPGHLAVSQTGQPFPATGNLHSLCLFPGLSTSVSLDLSVDVTTSKRLSLNTLKWHSPVTLQLIPQLHTFIAPYPGHLYLFIFVSLIKTRASGIVFMATSQNLAHSPLLSLGS